jgi:peptide chain release factor subunit 1
MIETDTIDRVVQARGEGLPLVSLYVRIDPTARRSLESQLTALLDQIRPLAFDDAVDHHSRISLRNDISRIREAARSRRWKPGAVGIFSCSGRGLFEEVQLPRAVRDRVVVDETPWIRPMLGVLDEYHRTGLLIVDKKTAQLWEVYQDEMHPVASIEDPALRQPNHAAGNSERNVHNRAQVLLNRHYRRVVEVLDQLVRTKGFEVLLVGGRDHEVPGFVDFLPPDLRERMFATFTVDPGTATAGDLRRIAATLIERYERDEERRLVGEILETTAAGGRAVAGLEPCLWAGSMAAIESLVVQEGATVPGVVCDQSAWFGLSGRVCALCGAPTRRVPDVIDELVTSVIENGGAVEHVEAQTGLPEHILAAKLRFPLPPQPTV